MSKQLPHALRGVDMVVYTVFKSLDLEVQIRPILDNGDLHEIDARQYERYEYYHGYEFDEWMDERCYCPRVKVGKAFHELCIGDYTSPLDEDYDIDFEDVRPDKSFFVPLVVLTKIAELGMPLANERSIWNYLAQQTRQWRQEASRAGYYHGGRQR